MAGVVLQIDFADKLRVCVEKPTSYPVGAECANRKPVAIIIHSKKPMCFYGGFPQRMGTGVQNCQSTAV